MKLPVEGKMVIRYKKCEKSIVLTRLFVVSAVSLLLLDNTSSLIEGRIIKIPHNDSISNTGNDGNVCLTPGCRRSATTILDRMDPEVDPCDDFYRYACGGFIKKTTIPDSESVADSFVVEENKIRELIKLNLETKIEPNETKHSRLVKNFYKLCINETAHEAIGFKYLSKQLNEMGGWPVLLGAAWREDKFNWAEMVYKFRDAGYSSSSLINFGIVVDLKNNKKSVIDIDQPKFYLDRTDLTKGFNNSLVDAYYRYMIDTAVMLGADKLNALTELKESLTFEMNLANISLPQEELRDPTKLYNPMTLSELSKKYPSIPWKEYLERMLPSSITVEEDEVVNVNVPSYIADLEKLLSSVPKRTQANYLMWRAIAKNLRFLHNDASSRWQRFLTVLNGNTERKTRRDECAQTAQTRFPIIIAAMYVRRYFKEEAKKNAVAMVKDIKNQLEDTLRNADWMHNETRKKALEKASAMVSHVGYPDELLNDQKINELYENYEISGNNYLENMLNLKKFKTDFELNKLREPVSISDWTKHADSAIVNAYYEEQSNSFNLPAGILQGVFFDKDRPNYMNYGAMGFFIGHEITHGFDDEGRTFDADGKLRNWWDASTEKNFRQRAQCIIDQYGNYTVPEIGMKLNGRNTQGENIADNGGIKITYLAYKNWISRNKAEKMLPGIDRTPEQMFWLSSANSWCWKVKREYLRFGVVSDVHSPNDFRILGAFSNMQEFANDYKCPKGSKMNPTKKCSVW